MKIHARYKDHVFTRDHKTEVTLTVASARDVAWIDTLENEVDYAVEIKKVKSKRSIEQNALLWSLLHKLEQVTREPAMDWYIKALIETGAVVDYVWGTVETEDTLKKTFRAVQRVKPHQIKGTDGWLYRVIVGSSKFNVKQMNQLIDTVERYCYESDIEVDRI